MTTPTATTVTPRRHVRLRWLGLALLSMVLLLGLVGGWLLGTGAGLRFALARAVSASAGALSVQHASGRLIGPLELRGVRYRDGKGTEVKLASAHLDLAFWPLLRRQLHVLDLQAGGIEITLPPATPNDAQNRGNPDLQPPLPLWLDRVRLGKLTISRGGQPVFAADSLALAGAWTDDGITVRQLQLHAPDGQVELLAGALQIGDGYRGAGKLGFAWRVGTTAYAGTLQTHGDGRQTQLELALTRPAVAHLQLHLAQRGTHAWTATLDAPRFDPAPLLGTRALTALALALHGSGDDRGGTLDGQLDLNDHPLLLQPLRARISDDFKTLRLEQLTLASPQTHGSVNASGVFRLDAQPLSGTFAMTWHGLDLPAGLARTQLASYGRLDASGSMDRFHVQAGGAIGTAGKPAEFSLELDGTRQSITLHTLALTQPQGSLQASGTLTLQPVPGWRIEARAQQFDPGQWLAGWDGALNADIASSGTLPSQGPDATLEIRRLDGQLRQRPVRGTGRLHLSADRVLDGRLDLASGGSAIHLRATPGRSNDLDLNLAIASLGDWLPDASGRLDGHFAIRGRWPGLSINGTSQGQALAWRQQRIDRLKLIAGLPDLSRPSGKLDLHSQGVHVGGLSFQHIDLLAEGSQARHRLQLDAAGSQLSAQLVLDGSRQGAAWNGTLSTLNLAPQGLPRWHLQQPVQLAWSGGAMRLSELCLRAGDPLLCVAARRESSGAIDASYRLRAVPLALLANAAGLADLPVRADGMLEGHGELHRSAAGKLGGSASLGSAQGTLNHADHTGQPLLSWRDLALDARFGPTGQHLDLRADLDAGGRLDGQLDIRGARQALHGQIALRLHDLAFVELLTSELANVKGGLDGSFHIGGTLDRPLLNGQATLDGLAAEVPAAGLKLQQGHFVIGTSDARIFRIDGSVQSGKGTLAVSGSAGVNAETSISLKGSQFTAADIPSARLVISPDLSIRQNAQGIDIGGSLTLDSAEVDIARLPGTGVNRASPDVVVLDETALDKARQAQQRRLPITAAVEVNLGNRTHVVGMGLDGNLRGRLAVSEQPGRAAIGRGQIAVDGTYKAYGQVLTIERGQLLFASTPLDNPGLDLRAVRKLNPTATIDAGQKVGLYVSGTARRPVLTVFSEPVMEQSDALSYLITGKPLSQVRGGEGNMVTSAAQALGSAGGNLLAKRIGAQLGIDEIGVSGNQALGGSSAFTVGKYLSPRLYLSYGVGLFEPGQVITLRYRLSKRWNFEAQNATLFNRASLNYRIEK